jgi:hypothetical protein
VKTFQLRGKQKQPVMEVIIQGFNTHTIPKYVKRLFVSIVEANDKHPFTLMNKIRSPFAKCMKDYLGVRSSGKLMPFVFEQIFNLVEIVNLSIVNQG